MPKINPHPNTKYIVYYTSHPQETAPIYFCFLLILWIVFEVFCIHIHCILPITFPYIILSFSKYTPWR